jgi:predicted site-specific integrase-resolvase
MPSTTKPIHTPDEAVCWTVDQFAARYQVNRSTIYNWLNRGLLQSVKISGARRILPEHDQAFRERFQSGEAA